MRDRLGRNRRYLHREPSAKALTRERQKLRQRTGPTRCFTPISVLVWEINRRRKGGREYFPLGHPRQSFRKMGCWVPQRLLRPGLGGVNGPSVPRKEPPGIGNGPRWAWCRCGRSVHSVRTPAVRGIGERRMREIRTSGVTRAEQVPRHGMRVRSHSRGNPETDVSRSLNTGTCSPTLLARGTR